MGENHFARSCYPDTLNSGSPAGELETEIEKLRSEQGQMRERVAQAEVREREAELALAKKTSTHTVRRPLAN